VTTQDKKQYLQNSFLSKQQKVLNSTKIKMASSKSETNIEVKCSKSGGDEKNGCGCKCHRVPVTLRDHFWKDPFFSSNWEDFDKIRQQVSKTLDYSILLSV
jgi:hypothetical protein